MEIQERYQQLVVLLEEKKRRISEFEGRRKMLEERFKELESEAKDLGLNSLDDLPSTIESLQQRITASLDACDRLLREAEVPQQQLSPVIKIDDLDDLLTNPVLE